MDGFLATFGDLDGLHKLLNSKISEILQEWKSLNAGKEMMGTRSPVQKLFNIAGYTWTNKKGKQERSWYDLQLNTYGFTMKNQREVKPIIRTKDVTVIYIISPRFVEKLTSILPLGGDETTDF